MQRIAAENTGLRTPVQQNQPSENSLFKRVFSAISNGLGRIKSLFERSSKVDVASLFSRTQSFSSTFSIESELEGKSLSETQTSWIVAKFAKLNPSPSVRQTIISDLIIAAKATKEEELQRRLSTFNENSSPSTPSSLITTTLSIDSSLSTRSRAPSLSEQRAALRKEIDLDTVKNYLPHRITRSMIIKSTDEPVLPFALDLAILLGAYEAFSNGEHIIDSQEELSILEFYKNYPTLVADIILDSIQEADKKFPEARIEISHRNCLKLIKKKILLIDELFKDFKEYYSAREITSAVLIASKSFPINDDFETTPYDPSQSTMLKAIERVLEPNA